MSREEAERRRGFDPDVPPADRAKNRSLFFDDLLDTKLREFNPRYAEAEGALLGQFRHLHYVIVHELLHFSVPNHGKLWKSLMRSHLGEYEAHEGELKRISGNKAPQRTR